MKSFIGVQFTAFKGLLGKEVTRILRIWPQTIVPSAITVTLYFMIFGQVIGERVGAMAGVPYMFFIVPGLIMMALITNSYSNVAASFFSIRLSRSVEELLVAPVHNHVIIWGYMFGGVFRGLIVAITVYIVSHFFISEAPAHPFLACFVALMASSLFALLGLLNGIYARRFDDIAIVPTFILTPLIYLGGVFYNIKVLPEMWQVVVPFNPIYHLIGLFRYALIGVDRPNVLVATTAITCMFTLTYIACYLCLKKGYGIKP